MLSARGEDERRLMCLAKALLDNAKARVVVKPTAEEPGFWFGAGNIIRDPSNPRRLLLSGRYRAAGDSREGLIKGVRGYEIAIFASEDEGITWTKLRSWNKEDVRPNEAGEVVSIEGSALRVVRIPGPSGTTHVIQVLVSSEKAVPYPSELAAYQKPGTGCWSIDEFHAPTIEELDPRGNIRSLLGPFMADPARLHVKDPNVSGRWGNTDLLLYCTHPFCWSSGATGAAVFKPGSLELEPRYAEQVGKEPEYEWDFFPRGATWDVATNRITCRLPIPRIGYFAESGRPNYSLYFYDGAESMRPLPAHTLAVHRARGYSCEEVGGVAFGQDPPPTAEPGRPAYLRRLSRLQPMFVSPTGTGCHRYVSVTVDDLTGDMLVLWQQSAESGAQHLWFNRLSASEVAACLL